MKILYCPVCGSKISFGNKCCWCDTDIKLAESKYDMQHYIDEADKLRPTQPFITYCEVLFNTEIVNNPHYDSIANQKAKSARMQKIRKFTQPKNQNIPKCPTCQSTNIKKISSTKRAVHGIAFGLLSKTAKSQFECLNCKYKW